MNEMMPYMKKKLRKEENLKVKGKKPRYSDNKRQYISAWRKKVWFTLLFRNV